MAAAPPATPITLSLVPRCDHWAWPLYAGAYWHARWQAIRATVDGRLGQEFHCEDNKPEAFRRLCAPLSRKCPDPALGRVLTP